MKTKHHVWFALAWMGLVAAIAGGGSLNKRTSLAAVEADLFTDEAALFGESEDEFGDSPAADKQSGVTLLRMAANISASRAPTAADAAVVSAVLDDAVLLRHGEVYSLDCCVSEAVNNPASEKSGPGLIDLRRNTAATQLARSYHQKLYINPFVLAGKVKIEASRKDGRMRYMLFPGTDKQAFSTFGLQAGDEVLGVNGVSLQRGDAIPVIYQQLAAADYIAVTLQRGGKALVVLLALDVPA